MRNEKITTIDKLKIKFNFSCLFFFSFKKGITPANKASEINPKDCVINVVA